MLCQISIARLDGDLRRDEAAPLMWSTPARSVALGGIVDVLTAARSPWQNPYAERMIGTIRRELLDHVIVNDEGHLRHQLHRYLRYYHGSRTLCLAIMGLRDRTDPARRGPCEFVRGRSRWWPKVAIRDR